MNSTSSVKRYIFYFKMHLDDKKTVFRCFRETNASLPNTKTTLFLPYYLLAIPMLWSAIFKGDNPFNLVSKNKTQYHT